MSIEQVTTQEETQKKPPTFWELIIDEIGLFKWAEVHYDSSNRPEGQTLIHFQKINSTLVKENPEATHWQLRKFHRIVSGGELGLAYLLPSLLLGGAQHATFAGHKYGLKQVCFLNETRILEQRPPRWAHTTLIWLLGANEQYLIVQPGTQRLFEAIHSNDTWFAGEFGIGFKAGAVISLYSQLLHVTPLEPNPGGQAATAKIHLSKRERFELVHRDLEWAALSYRAAHPGRTAKKLLDLAYEPEQLTGFGDNRRDLIVEKREAQEWLNSYATILGLPEVSEILESALG